MKISDIDKSKIKIGGRTTECLSPLSLIWTGSYVEFNVKASEFHILIEGPYTTYETWIAIEINGAILSRRMLSKEKEWITVFRMMNPNKPVRVRIIKEVQAFGGDDQHRVNVYEVKTDGQLLTVPNGKMKIEFVGDSINSAEGCAGAVGEEDWIAQYFSHVHSYPYLVGKSLDADINVISQSGYGVYASWDCDVNCAVPKYYEDIASVMQGDYFKQNGFSDKWDFDKWQPDVVVINLGTNDDFAFRNEDCANPSVLSMDGDSYRESDRIKVRGAIVDFLQVVRSKNPKAMIYWAFGMLGNDMADTILEAIDIVRMQSGDERIKYIKLPATGDDELGSRWHPGEIAHEKVADIITKVISES